MNNIFFIDRNIISYDDLINFINSNELCFDLTEVEKLILNEVKNLCNDKIENFEHLLTNIINNNFEITINTSGTTGKSKKIYHNINTITKNIKVDSRYEHSIWGLCYPFGKMAFYQVLFQSLFNKSRLVNLFGYHFDIIKDRIIEHNITNISATPTFYKMLLSYNHIYKKVTQVTLGGESLDENLLSNIKKYFPDSSIRNIYASTEGASLFTSDGNTFKIPEKYKTKIKIKENVIHIHKDLLGKIDESNIDDNWFNTQDNIEMVGETEFKFVGRKNLEINVSGFKINPYKVEGVINSLEYVENSVVYSKKNSVTGNILCCDVITDRTVTKLQIKEDLKQKLDKYEIPSLINFVDSLKINDSMKILRTL
jgi:acyl-coenzyme A synthetase/AMP-(fatty) acid ligase